MKKISFEDGVYILKRKQVSRGTIRECTNGIRNPGETRPTHELEAVLVLDARPFSCRDRYANDKVGEPVRVIGLREIDSSEPLFVWRIGFVLHPKHYYICTSAMASGLIPIESYLKIMKNLKTGDDVVELKNCINKFYGVCG